MSKKQTASGFRVLLWILGALLAFTLTVLGVCVEIFKPAAGGVAIARVAVVAQLVFLVGVLGATVAYRKKMNRPNRRRGRFYK